MLSEVAEKCDDCELWGSSCLQQSTGIPNNLDLEIALNVQNSSTDIQCVCMSHTLHYHGTKKWAYWCLIQMSRCSSNSNSGSRMQRLLVHEQHR
jgi:hypothetical protein